MTVPAFAVYITKALGRNKSLISIATSAILVLTSFFYIYTVGSYFKVGISVLHNFYNYIGFFQLYVVSKYIDHIIIALGISIWFGLAIKKQRAGFVVALIYGGLTIISVIAKQDVILDFLALLSIPLLILILAGNRFVPKMRILNKYVDTDLSSNYIIIAGLVITIAGVIVSLTPLFFTSASASAHVRNYAYEMFVLLSSFFSPLLMTLLILCFPFKLLFNRYISSKSVSINGSNNST